MSWLFRLVLLIVRLLLEWSIRLSLEIVGCVVRLLYWSVRTYGWGRVSSFIACLWLSLWLHHHFDRLSLSSTTLFSAAACTLGLWGAFVGSYRWLALQWRRRTERPLAVPCDLVPIPENTKRLAQELTSTEGAGGNNLWEKVVHPDTLHRAWQKVLGKAGGPGSDGMTVEMFALDAERRLGHLAMQLRAGTYSPRPPRWVEVPKPQGGLRRLAVLSVQDRVVQHALLSVLAPLWDGRFAPCSFAYRPGRSPLQAVREVERHLAAGKVWIVDADIEAFFDSVPHRQLFSILKEWLPDPRTRRLVEICVVAGSPEPGRGLAQGAPISPLLANLYLHRFDIALLEVGHTLIRYADDFVVLCATRQQAESALGMARRLLKGLGLSLNPDKTRVVHRDEGFTFLGFTFTREGKRPRQEAVEGLQLKLAATSDEAQRRQILAGWQGYFGEAPGWDEGFGKLSDFLSLYRARFLGRPDVFARYWQKGDRDGYTPVRRTVTDEDLMAHLNGEQVLGTYPLHPDGTTKTVILDVDGPALGRDGQALAMPLANRLAESLRQHGLAPIWFDSGGKGFHLWLCFRESVPARRARRWIARWLDGLRPFPEGTIVEVFPKQDRVAPGALGSQIRLPLGLHPKTGRPSLLRRWPPWSRDVP